MKWLIALFLTFSDGATDDPYYYTNYENMPYIWASKVDCEDHLWDPELLRVTAVAIKYELAQGADIEDFDLKCVLGDDPA